MRVVVVKATLPVLPPMPVVTVTTFDRSTVRSLSLMVACPVKFTLPRPEVTLRSSAPPGVKRSVFWKSTSPAPPPVATVVAAPASTITAPLNSIPPPLVCTPLATEIVAASSVTDPAPVRMIGASRSVRVCVVKSAEPVVPLICPFTSVMALLSTVRLLAPMVVTTSKVTLPVVPPSNCSRPPSVRVSAAGLSPRLMVAPAGTVAPAVVSIRTAPVSVATLPLAATAPPPVTTLTPEMITASKVTVPAPDRAMGPSTSVRVVVVKSTLPVVPVTPAVTVVRAELTTVRSLSLIVASPVKFTLPRPAVTARSSLPPGVRVSEAWKSTRPAPAPVPIAVGAPASTTTAPPNSIPPPTVVTPAGAEIVAASSVTVPAPLRAIGPSTSVRVVVVKSMALVLPAMPVFTSTMFELTTVRSLSLSVTWPLNSTLPVPAVMPMSFPPPPVAVNVFWKSTSPARPPPVVMVVAELATVGPLKVIVAPALV